ncbi:MAG TPA: stage II sporulation protein M [Pyrinomonadaceae bacterium]|nr:stage II sporulation protein M [Pyrinomonadaceae bacterium]
MSTERFINERKGAWQRLEDLLKLLDYTRLRRLHREEVRELGRIYRRTASDLAVARAESRDPRLVGYLNSLVIRAHGRIYRAEASEGRRRVRDFFAVDFPRTFRRTWRYTATAFSVYALFAALFFFGTLRDPEITELVGLAPAERQRILEEKPRWWLDINDANQVAASQIGTHNMWVAFYGFAYGALFGLGSLLVLAVNGAGHASVLALTFHAGYGHELLTFMAGHGPVELTCIFIAGGAGLLYGTAVLFPGDLPRLDNLRLRGREAVQLVVGCVPLLAFAGLIEGFISPADIPPAMKLAVSATTAFALYAYLILGGRGEKGEKGKGGKGEEGKTIRGL